MTARDLDNFLRTHRERLGLSQERLADRAGVTRQAIIAIEAGQRVPSTMLALRLGRALGCSVEELFSLAPISGLSVRIAPSAGPGAPQEASDRVALGRVDANLVAHRLGPDATIAADGVLAATHPDATGTAHSFGMLELIERNVLVAGCAPLLGALAQRVHERFADARMTWLPTSSTRALELLEAGLVHVAGLHLTDGHAANDNAQIVRRTFPGRRMLVINLTKWRQGFVVPAGNPASIRSAEDLLRPGLRMACREVGSGASGVVSRLLSGIGAADTSPAGPLAAGHIEVAQLVRWGAADVGVAIESVALAAGLGFVPIVEERFDLVVPASMADRPPVSRLLDSVGDRSFIGEVERLPGYDGSISGHVSTVEAA